MKGGYELAIEATRPYTLEEVSEILCNKANTDTILRYIKEGRLRAIRVNRSRGYLVMGADLLAFLDANATQPAES